MITKYTRVRLTGARGTGDSIVGKQLMKLVGECIAAGGAVTMDTYYKDNMEYANAELDWSTDEL